MSHMIEYLWISQAAARLADARKLVEEQFARYENPDLPQEYQAEVARAKARIVASFEKADERVKAITREDAPHTVAQPATERQRSGSKEEAEKLLPRSSFSYSEWVGLVLTTCGLVVASMSYTLWQKRADEVFARQFEKASPAVFCQLQSIGWHETLRPSPTVTK